MSVQDGHRPADRFEGAALRPPGRPTCLRCGFPITSRPMGCKNPCRNCGTVYPLGDCSD